MHLANACTWKCKFWVYQTHDFFFVVHSAYLHVWHLVSPLGKRLNITQSRQSMFQITFPRRESSGALRALEKVKMLQIGISRQENDWNTFAEKPNLYLSFFHRWTVLSNGRAFTYLRGLRSNCIISGTIEWCRIMSTMVAYCRVAVDHFLKMWKSLTPKSLYREEVNPLDCDFY